MNDKYTLDGVLTRLLHAAEGPCISLLLPRHPLNSGREADVIEMKQAIHETIRYLEQSAVESREALTGDIKALSAQIDFNHPGCGIGIFVAPAIRELIYFHTPVTKKMIVADRFEIRDLLFESAYNIPYFLLLLTENKASLFEGRFDRLAEVTGNGFPQRFTDDHIYQPPSRGNAYAGQAVTQSYEADKSAMTAIRYTAFFRKVDAMLDQLSINGSIFLVAAATKELAAFKQVSRHTGRILWSVVGNYQHDMEALQQKAWLTCRQIIDDNNAKALAHYQEAFGQHRGEEGVQAVWKAVRQGRGLTLLVEKDLRMPGFIADNDPSLLHLSSITGNHQIIPDAVEDIIRASLDNHVQVIFYPNGMLHYQQGIALVTRY